LKKYILFPTLLLSLSLTFSQTDSKTKLKGTYIALVAETRWIYEFNLNYTYTFKTIGHFGNSTTKGYYTINQDTIFLTAFTKQKQNNPNFYFESDTLVLEGDTCLIKLSTGYEHLLIKNKNDTIYSSRRRNMRLPGRPLIVEN
jgi:hypothetical protein